MLPDDALDEVEEAIRRAEELMSRDLEMLTAPYSPDLDEADTSNEASAFFERGFETEKDTADTAAADNNHHHQEGNNEDDGINYDDYYYTEHIKEADYGFSRKGPDQQTQGAAMNWELLAKGSEQYTLEKDGGLDESIGNGMQELVEAQEVHRARKSIATKGRHDEYDNGIEGYEEVTSKNSTILDHSNSAELDVTMANPFAPDDTSHRNEKDQTNKGLQCRSFQDGLQGHNQQTHKTRLSSREDCSSAAPTEHSSLEEPREGGKEGKEQINLRTRYQSREAREDLINRLLREREEAMAARAEVQRLAKEVEDKEHEQRQVEEKRLQTLERERRQGNQLRTRPGSAPSQTQGRQRSKLRPRANSGMHENARFTRKTLDQVKREVEEQRSRDCTFKPRLKPYRGPMKSKLQNETGVDRLERLAQPKSEYWVRFEEERRAKESANLQETCTFQPDISLAQPKEANSDWQQRVQQAYRNHVPVEKRLHLDANERWAAREKAKRELEDAEMQAQPFRPQVNPVSEEITKQINYEPIDKRASRVQREKQEKLVKKQLEFELSDGNLTFKPAISEQSQRLALLAALRRGEAPSRDVVDRLLARSNSVHERKNHREHEAARQEEDSCKNAPRVSRNSENLLQGNELYDGRTAFVERQMRMEELRRAKDQQRRAEAHDMSGVATFRPKTHQPDAVLIRTRPELLAETKEQRIERLARHDQERKDRLHASIREHYYSQYNFKPQTNRISSEIVRDTRKVGSELFEDLYRNQRGQIFRAMAESQVVEESLKDCTFKPKTLHRPGAEPSAAIRLSRFSAEQTIDHIERERRKKELRLLEQKREQEFAELRECTFTPAVNVPRSVPIGSSHVGGRVVIRGLSRHLEKQEMAKRQIEELREREAKVFLQDADRIRPEPYTVPEPFNLSEGNARRKNGPQFSFHPKTNVQTKRKQIEHILSRS